MTIESHPYLFLAVFFVMAIGFCAAPLFAAWLWSKYFSPAKPGAVKNATYECGLETKDSGALRVKPEYYLYGIIFLVFDVETIFLLPFAAAFPGLSWGGFAAILIFLLFLAEGLAWAWQKGVLTWK